MCVVVCVCGRSVCVWWCACVVGLYVCGGLWWNMYICVVYGGVCMYVCVVCGGICMYVCMCGLWWCMYVCVCMVCMCGL